MASGKSEDPLEFDDPKGLLKNGFRSGQVITDVIFCTFVICCSFV